jgi:hypothetical protein
MAESIKHSETPLDLSECRPESPSLQQVFSTVLNRSYWATVLTSLISLDWQGFTKSLRKIPREVSGVKLDRDEKQIYVCPDGKWMIDFSWSAIQRHYGGYDSGIIYVPREAVNMWTGETHYRLHHDSGRTRSYSNQAALERLIAGKLYKLALKHAAPHEKLVLKEDGTICLGSKFIDFTPLQSLGLASKGETVAFIETGVHEKIGYKLKNHGLLFVLMALLGENDAHLNNVGFTHDSDGTLGFAKVDHDSSDGLNDQNLKEALNHLTANSNYESYTLFAKNKPGILEGLNDISLIPDDLWQSAIMEAVESFSEHVKVSADFAPEVTVTKFNKIKADVQFYAQSLRLEIAITNNDTQAVSELVQNGLNIRGKYSYLSLPGEGSELITPAEMAIRNKNLFMFNFLCYLTSQHDVKKLAETLLDTASSPDDMPGSWLQTPFALKLALLTCRKDFYVVIEQSQGCFSPAQYVNQRSIVPKTCDDLQKYLDGKISWEYKQIPSSYGLKDYKLFLQLRHGGSWYREQDFDSKDAVEIAFNDMAHRKLTATDLERLFDEGQCPSNSLTALFTTKKGEEVLRSIESSQIVVKSSDSNPISVNAANFSQAIQLFAHKLGGSDIIPIFFYDESSCHSWSHITARKPLDLIEHCQGPLKKDAKLSFVVNSDNTISVSNCASDFDTRLVLNGDNQLIVGICEPQNIETLCCA